MFPVIPPAQVEADSTRRYTYVNDAACELLGYTRDELLGLRIDDISFPSGAHVKPMYTQFLENGDMRGIFALRRKSGEVIWVRFQAETVNGRYRSTFTHYEPWDAMRTSAAPALRDQF
jgi:PAS domain S-box-containing protein